MKTDRMVFITKTPWADCVPLAVERLDWALQRIETFSDEIETFLCAGPYAVIPTKKVELGACVQITYSFCGNAKPPSHLRFMAGDIVHNLRATVDNLVWGVANASGADKRLALEFKNGPTHFAQFAESKKIDLLPGPIRTWYEDEQLHRRERTPVWRERRLTTEALQHPSTLHILTKLWNRDKHRSPALMASSNIGVWTGFTTPCGGWRHVNPGDEVRITGYGGALKKDGAPVAQFVLHADQVADFKPRFSVDVAFEDGPGSARRFLFRAEHHIRNEVLPKFAPFLT